MCTRQACVSTLGHTNPGHTPHSGTLPCPSSFLHTLKDEHPPGDPGWALPCWLLPRRDSGSPQPHWLLPCAEEVSCFRTDDHLCRKPPPPGSPQDDPGCCLQGPPPEPTTPIALSRGQWDEEKRTEVRTKSTDPVHRLAQDLEQVPLPMAQFPYLSMESFSGNDL